LGRVARWQGSKVSSVKGKTVNLNVIVNVNDFFGPQANESSRQ